jgi:hypothetical protein
MGNLMNRTVLYIIVAGIVICIIGAILSFSH